MAAPRFRTAGPSDAHAIAALHADSWQRHYRGAYTDTFLDDEAPTFLTNLWTDRMTNPTQQAHTLVAEHPEHGGELVGLAHTILDASPTWGALLDNLHVRYALKRQGLGTRLLAETRQAVHRLAPSSGVYLWVLEQNTAWLNGTPMCVRYSWPSVDRDPAAVPGSPKGSGS